MPTQTFYKQHSINKCYKIINFLNNNQAHDDDYLLNKLYDDVSEIYDDILGSSESEKSSTDDEGKSNRYITKIMVKCRSFYIKVLQC